MSSFHLKLYYMMADKNTNAGQSLTSNQQQSSGMAVVQPSKVKKQKAPPQSMVNISQMPLPKKLLVLTNQQEIKEQRQLEAKRLNVSLMSRKKKNLQVLNMTVHSLRKLSNTFLISIEFPMMILK